MQKPAVEASRVRVVIFSTMALFVPSKVNKPWIYTQRNRLR
uniref:Uncharacterized protein n=1 Tax=Rhizophora mucronata TaxID=61149 RepID=A0A2P2QWZ4_RHIMU